MQWFRDHIPTNTLAWTCPYFLTLVAMLLVVLVKISLSAAITTQYVGAMVVVVIIGYLMGMRRSLTSSCAVR